MSNSKLGGIKFNSLIVRLKRSGCMHNPFYEVVLMKKKSRSDGLVLEKLGFLNLKFNLRFFTMNSKSLAFWLNSGVVVHNTVKKYMVKLLV